MTKLTTYDEAATAGRLKKDLPHWSCAGGTIQRTYKTSGWTSTLVLVTTIGHLAEAAWHHPDLIVTYDQVVVKLSTHSAGGITDLDFLLAAKIEETAAWKPGPPFSGPPAEHGHVKHER